ncbi:uncharacterized protein TRAVEDRAFT_28588 [Trametes versicolor FP-101664 SS1]|uniref:uncharacterized protein n=1 Tax=Trametes versicolor (strain FP-101664) TaxID=717944 RepID=UPI0004624850|nr:uncharacterized protein TRAVEDRAFT_28588 [Trametes versicolor FP-101664 SS1]EIW59406.1 hypothetical protein TRAVEDRAFT_28588 [Trametes versicolor FP-101664 SS1]
MSARTFSRRLFASLRTPASARAAARPAGRRFASTSVEHGAKQSSDLPWMAAYLLTSSGKEKGKHNADAHHDKAAKAHAPSEELIKKEEAPAPAEDADASKDDEPAEKSDSAPADDGAVTDDEGTTASAKDVDASVKQASDSDSPADAQRAEEHDAKFSQGAPGQTADAETEHEQKEKPGSSKSGTVQGEGDKGPTDLGDAREKSKSNQAPKEAAQD